MSRFFAYSLIALAISAALITPLVVAQLRPSPTDGPEDNECPICLEDINANDLALTSPCHHKYHFKCIHEWTNHRTSCPVCRGQVTQLLHNIKTDGNYEEAKVGRPQRPKSALRKFFERLFG